MKKEIIVLTLMACVLTCSDFILKDKNEARYSGRTMDFPIFEDSIIVSVPNGTYFESYNLYGGIGIRWYSNNSYVSVSSFGYNNTVDGMNECGLSFDVQTLMMTQYPNSTDTESLSVNLLGDYILGLFCTVKEVEENIGNLNLWPGYLLGDVPTPLLHISIHDETGHSLVIEFIKGQVVFHDNTIGVLTNEPTFDFHLLNIAQYNYVSNSQKRDTVSIDKYEAQSYFYPMLGVYGDYGSISRFVKLAKTLQFLETPRNEQEAFIACNHILNQVDVVRGLEVVNDKDEVLLYGRTIWSTIRDHNYRRLYFRSYHNPTWVLFDLKNIDFSSYHKIASLDNLSAAPYYEYIDPR